VESVETRLILGEKLSVPIDFATARCAVVGISGSGKSTAFTVMAEESYARKIPFTWIDPLGASWGMQSSADGLGPGLPIPIFGGYHGNLPLRADSGAWLAREIYELGISAILDLSAFDPREQCRFVTDHFLAMTQLHLQAKKVRSMFLDEAATIAPQRPSNEDDYASATAVWRMHTGGRAIGLGLKTATQSAAEQDKRTMKQAELFVALRTFSPHDQKPILDYLRTSVDAARAKEIVGTLAHLKNGEAWFIAPQWLNEVKRGRFRMRTTFDSSRTPALGETLTEPKALAEVDVERIRLAMTADAANVDLGRRMSVPLPNGDPGRRITASEVAGITAQLEHATNRLNWATGEIERLTRENEAMRERLLQIGALTVLREDVPTETTEQLATPPKLTLVPTKAPPAPKASSADARLHPAAKKLLVALAQHHPANFTWAQIATLAGLKPSGGHYNSGRSELRNLGYVHENGDIVSITQAGLEEAGEVPESPSTPEERLTMWCARLPSPAPDMLRRLAKNGSSFMEVGALADAIGRKPIGGHWNTGIAVLRNNGLVEMSGKAMRVSHLLRIQ
jgi:hypothetical protein